MDQPEPALNLNPRFLPLHRHRWLLLGFGRLAGRVAWGQELEPGAYSPAAIGMNIAVVPGGK